MIKQARFFLCVIGAILVFQIDTGVLFNAAGLNAVANLFSGQYVCSVEECRVEEKRRFAKDPVSLFHYGTTLAGAGFCMYGAIVFLSG